jgi:hypothetical protein
VAKQPADQGGRNSGDTVEIEAKLTLGNATEIGFQLRKNGVQETLVGISREQEGVH